jgi:hypothetical protein
MEWNARSIENIISELLNNFNADDIILIVETWLRYKGTLYLKGFDLFRKDIALRRGGGLAIAISSSLRYRTRGNLFDCNELIEIVAVEIFTKDGPLIVAICYKPPIKNTIDSLRVYSLLAGTLTPTISSGVAEKIVETGLNRPER